LVLVYTPPDFYPRRVFYFDFFKRILSEIR